MNLNLEGREKLREFVEEQLKKVPEGKRLVLPNETLEQLLFEEVVVNEKENIRVKFPVWSGKFLRKLDLSHVNFENVDWYCLWFLVEDKSYRDNDDCEFIGLFEFKDIATGKFYDDEDMFRTRLKGVQSLERLYSGVVDYSFSNATIDLSQSFLSKYLGRDSILGCNFNGCNVYFSKILNENPGFGDCDFSNTSIKLPKKINDNHIFGCNFENCDLSETEFDVTFMLSGGDTPNNLKNTGAKITYDPEDIKQDLLNKYMDTLLVGCYLDGELIRTPEEREQIKKEQAKLSEQSQSDELERMFGEISSTISSQLDEETPKTM